MVCSWLTRGEALKGQFGPRIQSYIEMSITNYQVLRGRPILNMIVREFDLDDALGGVISAVELFQIPSPEGDYSSLVTFRDKAQHVLTQLPIAERPSDAMLSKWLYERLKKVRSFSIIIDRIKESVAGSNERTFDYLWSRLMRHIAEQQHDKNLSSTQEDLRKGPRKTTSGATAKPEPKAKSKVETPDASGAVAKGKGKGKGKGKTKSAPNTTKPPDSKNPGGTSTSQGDGKKGPCIFFPKGLCRRGTDCPYQHEGTPAADPKAKALAKPKAAAMVALVGSVIGAAAYVPPTVQEVYQVEWALDSSAGEHLASREALVHQGIPQSVIEECETCSSKPLTFSTGGGLKEADVTIKTQGDLLGD